MNKNIFKSRTVLFLGAGASAFLNKPLMNQFVDHLLEDPNIDEDGKNIVKVILSTKGKYKDLEVILDEIDGICKRDYLHGGSERNFIKDLFDATYSNPFAKFLQQSSSSDLPSTSDFGTRYKKLCDLCKGLRWDIYDTIFRLYSDIENLKVASLYDPFLGFVEKSLHKKNKILPIFTTNYDKAIEVLPQVNNNISVFDGFKFDENKSMRIWWISNFNDFKPKKNKINVCLFKLHGSISWYRLNKKNNQEIVDTPVTTLYPSESGTEPVILYPNNTKSITFDPFITSYCYLQRCFDNAELIIFIGYSFRDYTTITFLKSALRYNKNLKVLIIDPRANKLLDTHFTHYKKQFACIDISFTDKAEEYSDALSKFLGL